MVTPLDFMCILPKFTAYFRCSNGRFFPGFGPRQLSGLNAAYLETICAQIFHSRCCERGDSSYQLMALNFIFFPKSWGKFTDQFWQIGVKFAFSHQEDRTGGRGWRRNALVRLSILDAPLGDLFLNQITGNNQPTSAFCHCCYQARALLSMTLTK